MYYLKFRQQIKEEKKNSLTTNEIKGDKWLKMFKHLYCIKNAYMYIKWKQENNKRQVRAHFLTHIIWIKVFNLNVNIIIFSLFDFKIHYIWM